MLVLKVFEVVDVAYMGAIIQILLCQLGTRRRCAPMDFREGL